MALLVSLFFPADYKWNYEFDEEIGYHHLCSTKGWKDFQERRDRKAAELGKDLKLITVIPYLDEYEHHQSRHESYLAIYITLGNIPVTVRKWQMRAQCGLELGRADPILQEMKKAKNRHLVAAVPSKLVDLFEVIQHVLVNPALELEGGYEAEYSASRNATGKEHFIGSIFSIQGDHKGQAEISGLLSASATYASRYSTCPRSEFWKTPLDWANEGRQMPRRNPDQSKQLIEEQRRILS